jgi:hypothetical protein
MKEININNIEEFINVLLFNNPKEEERFSSAICGGKITRTTTKVVKTTTTSELIEDGQLIKDLVEFCNNRYVYNGRRINEVKVINLLLNKYRILDIYKYDEDGDYMFVMDYPDIYNYRWEGDYNPDAEPTIRRYSFSEVLDEFIELHPDKCRWTEAVETRVEESWY